MTRALVLLAALPACYAPHPQPGSPCVDTPCPTGLECSPVTRVCELPGGGGGVDGGSGTPDVAPESRCFGTGLVQLCLDAAPQQPLVLGGPIDTDASPACVPYDGTGLCVVAGRGIAIAVTVRATGSRPLVLVSSMGIDVAGTIDVASRRSGTSMNRGAGSATGTCGGAGVPLRKDGGPGGSFGGAGGRGGRGEGSSATVPAAPAIASVTAPRGGCNGIGGVGMSPGAGGAGGGSVYLIARTGITILGGINASGAGGVGAPMEAGGGGGGSGGMIGLDAPSISLAGDVFANGGGGGEGGGVASGTSGANPISAAVAAPGGADTAAQAGNGGAGSVGASAPGAGGNNTSTAGGGGGGGGEGMIFVFGNASGVGTISPPAR